MSIQDRVNDEMYQARPNKRVLITLIKGIDPAILAQMEYEELVRVYCKQLHGGLK